MSLWTGEGMKFLDIHFLDVGHGDCTMVEFPERLTVIDINNCKSFGKETESELRKRNEPPPLNPFLSPSYGRLSGLARPTSPFSALGGLTQPPAQSPPFGNFLAQMVEAQRKLQAEKDKLTDPIVYFKANFPGRPIFRYIQSHPDMDHMAGLYRLWVQEKIEIVNFWDTKHRIEKDEVAMRRGEVNHDVRDWQTYKRLRSGVKDPTVLHLTHGTNGTYWTQDGIYIWAPLDHSESDNEDADPNGLSYLLRIQFGKSDIVLGGDATIETWKALYERYKGLPKIGLLKASHHGRKSGYHMESIKAMNPDLTIVSVGELKAKDDASASYERFSRVGCYSTLDHGDIIARCFIDGEIRIFERNGKQIASSWD